MGGYRVQGRGDQGEQLISDARVLEEAGAFAVVLEVVPQELAAQITSAISIPTIGIGAGVHTDAQVIVWQDLLGLTPGTPAKFVKQYADLRTSMTSALKMWANDVVNGTYPDETHSYN